MGNKQAKELKEKALETCTLHGDDGSKNVFASSFVTKTALKLKGKGYIDQGKGGYMFFDEGSDDKKTYFKTLAEGPMGRKGALYDADANLVCYIRIDHSFKKDVHKYYKTEPSYEGQAADSEKAEDKDIYLFAKIEAARSGQGSSSTYSVVTGKEEGADEEEFKALYKAQQVVAMSFMAQIETVEGSKVVGKITSLHGPRLQLEAAVGTDLAAVILTGEATSPAGATVAQLPGATFY